MTSVDVVRLDPADRSAAAERLWHEHFDLAVAHRNRLYPGEPAGIDPDASRARALAPGHDDVVILSARRGDDALAGATLTVKQNSDPVLAWFWWVWADGKGAAEGQRAVLHALEAESRRRGAAWVEVNADQPLAPGTPWDALSPDGEQSPETHVLTECGYHRYSTVVVSRARLGHGVLDRAEAALADVAADAYDVQVVLGPPPPAWHGDLAVLMERISMDAPHGSRDPRVESWDAAKVAACWETAIETGHEPVVGAVWHRATRTIVGWTEISRHRSFPTLLAQGDTIVLPAHRGHRLGLRVKTATTRAAMAAFPDSEAVETNNALSNAPMIAVNRILGYQPHTISPQYLLDLR